MLYELYRSYPKLQSWAYECNAFTASDNIDLTTKFFHRLVRQFVVQ